MKRQSIKKITTTLPLLMIALLFQNCAKTDFASVPQQSIDNVQSIDPDDPTNPVPPITTATPTPPILTTGTVSCTNVLNQINVPVRLLFVVDTSGSNAGGNGTDPTKLYRAGSIQQFFNNYSTKINFSWGFIHFSNNQAPSLIQGFANNPSVMQGAINAFNAVQDNGNTPYAVALAKARDTIAADTRTPDTKYIVAFISDGLPDPARSDAQLAADVQAILAAAPNQVSFSTIYYGNANAVASNRLKAMATVGKGNFLDTNANPNGRSFPIESVVTVPGMVCQ